MAERGFIVHPTYRVRSGRPVVLLWGRLESGEAFLVEDDRHRPYFFIGEQHADAISAERDVTVEETALRDLSGNAVLRITVQDPGRVPALRDRLSQRGGVAFEADIRFAYRVLIDLGVRASVSIDGEAERTPQGTLCYRNPVLAPCDFRPDLRVLSIDLETSPDASSIYSAALATPDVEEVHWVSARHVEAAIEYPDERAFLAGVCERIRELDPDCIVGWNVVDFDLKVLERRGQELGSPCRLGRDDSLIRFQQDRGFTRQSRATVAGRMILDGIPLVRDAMRLEDYRLETVARHVLGRGKLIDGEAPDAGAEIDRLYREDPAALVAYNLEDARLVLEILDREGLFDLTVERSLLCGMQLDRVGASIASFDLAYLPELRRRGVVAPSVDTNRIGAGAGVKGGAVLDSEPGIFPNVALFDFKSLYPSLIRTFNLDPLAHARGANEADAIRSPNEAVFSRHEALLPEVIERFMEGRDRAKARGDRNADQAIKIMMNSLFGVLGAPACRFFDPAIANAITHFGQQTLLWTQQAFEDEGVRVIYGDTDSVFVRLETEEPGEAAQREADRLREHVERQIAERIEREYSTRSELVLELERIYDRFFMPRVRRGGGGSKKRYAGSIAGRLDIVGLEAVRRDWPAIAGRLQRGLLERLFSDREVMPFTKQLISEVQDGVCDADLVYVKRVRKGSLEQYTATNAPHIQAARKAGGTQRGIIRYVITSRGPEPVLPKGPLPGDIDRRHYLEKVLRPIADSILSEVGHSFDEAMGIPQQLSLL